MTKPVVTPATTQVWKFMLDPYMEQNGIIEVEMPADATGISCHSQRERICVWAEVFPTNKLEKRYFAIYANGQDIPIPQSKRHFAGTVLMHGGSLVFHVFEVFK